LAAFITNIVEPKFSAHTGIASMNCVANASSDAMEEKSVASAAPFGTAASAGNGCATPDAGISRVGGFISSRALAEGHATDITSIANISVGSIFAVLVTDSDNCMTAPFAIKHIF
jgi:hypothetical protein